MCFLFVWGVLNNLNALNVCFCFLLFLILDAKVFYYTLTSKNLEQDALVLSKDVKWNPLESLADDNAATNR